MYNINVRRRVKNIHIILYNVEEPGIIQGPLRERETALRFRAKGTSARVQVPLQYRQRATHMCTHVSILSLVCP